MAAATDIAFNARGYMAVLANDVLTSLYLIMVKNTPASNGLSTTGELSREGGVVVPGGAAPCRQTRLGLGFAGGGAVCSA